MAQDISTPAPEAPPANQVRTESHQTPLPASEKDLRGKRFNARDPRFRLFLIIGGIVVIVAIFFLWRYLGSYEATDDAQVDGHLNSISARVSGHVAKLLVDDNQIVQAGQVLVEIDPSDYQIALDHAKADYDDAVAAEDDESSEEQERPGALHPASNDGVTADLEDGRHDEQQLEQPDLQIVASHAGDDTNIG